MPGTCTRVLYQYRGAVMTIMGSWPFFLFLLLFFFPLLKLFTQQKAFRSIFSYFLPPQVAS